MRTKPIAARLEKLLEKQYNYYVNNENQKTNKILLILTFFIAIGEISNITRNYIEVTNQDLFLKIFGIGVILVLLIFLYINIIHDNRMKEASDVIQKEGDSLIDSLKHS